MTTYVELGPRTKTGAADTTGNNAGKWTVTFAPADLNTNMPYYEVYKVIISGAAGSTMNWFVEQNIWEATIAADINAWDPQQPLVMRAGQTIYMYWSDLVTDNDPPDVTIWLRYDQDIDANQRAVVT